MRRVTSLIVGSVAALLGGAACRSTVASFGDVPAAAQRNADELFAALEYRFDSVRREPKFDAARWKMGRYALVPSAIYDDTLVWTLVSDSSRAIYVHAARDTNHYVFTSAAGATPPSALGAQSHFMRLTSLGRGDYQWVTSVDHAVGHVKPSEVARTIVSVLTAAEGRTGDAAFDDARAAFPRATAHLSRLFSLDSLRTTPAGDGATQVTLGFRFRPDRLRPDAPAFAAYVDKYVVPSFYRAALAGADGSRYVEVSGGDGHVQVSLCARDGRLVSLDTPRRPLPDSLVLRSDFSARYRRFRIGYTGMVTDFTIERGPHLAAWMLRFRHEPAWHFPLAFDKLIRTPLRRPFEDRGMELRLGLRDGEGEQTSSFREARLTVHESAIMRWLGRLGATAFGEFSGRAEAEENLFLTQFFAALRADVTGLSER